MLIIKNNKIKSEKFKEISTSLLLTNKRNKLEKNNFNENNKISHKMINLEKDNNTKNRNLFISKKFEKNISDSNENWFLELNEISNEKEVTNNKQINIIKFDYLCRTEKSDYSVKYFKSYPSSKNIKYAFKDQSFSEDYSNLKW